MFDTAPGWQSRMSCADRVQMDNYAEEARLRRIVEANKGDYYAEQELSSFLRMHPDHRRDGDPE